jgi:hypothetical protein
MAAGDVKLTLRADEFYTATRLRRCMNSECRFNGIHSKDRDAGLWCQLKRVELNQNGRCESVEFLVKVPE